MSQTWSNTILSIAHQIIDHVRPDLNHDADNLDIRQYVQFKKCLGDSRDDCEIVSGIICSKNIAHRGMNAMIAHPKILLLQCGLMYQRVEGKLISLEPVMMQVRCNLLLSSLDQSCVYTCIILKNNFIIF